MSIALLGLGWSITTVWVGQNISTGAGAIPALGVSAEVRAVLLEGGESV